LRKKLPNDAIENSSETRLQRGVVLTYQSSPRRTGVRPPMNRPNPEHVKAKLTNRIQGYFHRGDPNVHAKQYSIIRSAGNGPCAGFTYAAKLSNWLGVRIIKGIIESAYVIGP